MPKVIKLKESDIYNIANKIIAEQLQQNPEKEETKGIGPYPPKEQKTIITSKPSSDGMSPYPAKTEQTVSAEDQRVITLIRTTKDKIKQNMVDAKNDMERLIKVIGFNPGIGKITAGLENVLKSYDELFGMPENDPKAKIKE